jgi:hypothetical protein
LLKAQRLVPGGPRSRDPFVLLASMPGMLAWAVIETALLVGGRRGGLDQAVG